MKRIIETATIRSCNIITWWICETTNSVIKHHWAVPLCALYPSAVRQEDTMFLPTLRHSPTEASHSVRQTAEWTVNPPGRLKIAAGMFVVGLVKFVNRNMFSVTRRENSKSLTAQRGSKECFTVDINTEGTDLLQLSHSMALTQTHTHSWQSHYSQDISGRNKKRHLFLSESLYRLCFRYTCRNMYKRSSQRDLVWYQYIFWIKFARSFLGGNICVFKLHVSGCWIIQI